MGRGIRINAFGGGPLRGKEVVRLVYFDESGISSIKEEPHVVVAGVITEPDAIHRILEGYLAKMAIDWVPFEKQEAFIAFHAKDLFNGGEPFPRPEWTIERTLPIVKRLLRIPVRFGLPVVYGLCNRATHKINPPRVLPYSEAEKLEAAYQEAFLIALIRTNDWMRRHARPDELAMIVVEDNPSMRTALKRVQTWLRYPALVPEALVRFIPLDRIIESVVFAQKDESDILQVSDMLAYCIKRAAMPPVYRRPPKHKDIQIQSNADWLLGNIVPTIHWGPITANDPVRASRDRLRIRHSGVWGNASELLVSGAS